MPPVNSATAQQLLAMPRKSQTNRLASLAATSVQDLLLALCRSPERHERQSALAILLRLQQEALLSALSPHLQPGHPVSVELLQLMRLRSIEAGLLLGLRALYHAEAPVRAEAMLYLTSSRHQAALPLLLEQVVFDPDASVRRIAVHCLQAFGEEAAKTGIANALSDPAWLVREAAIKTQKIWRHIQAEQQRMHAPAHVQQRPSGHPFRDAFAA